MCFCYFIISHNENKSIQYTAIFSAVKMRKNVEKFDIFLIFAQNTDCGYMLEPTVSVLEQKCRKIWILL